jgi:hypothetical protein
MNGRPIRRRKREIDIPAENPNTIPKIRDDATISFHFPR